MIERSLIYWDNEEHSNNKVPQQHDGNRSKSAAVIDIIQAAPVTLQYPAVDLGKIFYPNQDDLRNKIELFVDEDAKIDNREFLHSTSHVRSCQIHFENESTIPMYCYWMQYNGDIHTPPHSIDGEDSLRLNSYISHPFIISTSDTLNAHNFETIIALYIPTNPNHAIHHVAIDSKLQSIRVTPFDEEMKMRCKCGRVLQDTLFDSNAQNDDDDDDDDDDDIEYICFACDRVINDGDRVWICDNIESHALKIYCLQCAQERSTPLGIIRAYRSDIDADYCCTDASRKYPRNYPRLFEAHIFIENTLRIVSLCCDLMLFYVLINNSIQYEKTFLRYLSSLQTTRVIFTFISGLIICIILFILYHVQMGCISCRKWGGINRECVGHICMMFVFLSLIFVYKVLLIGVCVFRIIFVFKRVHHSRPVSSDVEMKHVLLLYPLLFDSLLSGWPLLIISLVQLVHTISYNLATFTLVVKVVSCGILLFVDIDRLRLWRYSMYDPQMLVPVCILHTSRPYPMRALKMKESNKDMHCVVCGEICHDYVWHCAHLNCHGNTVCIECTFEYLGKYKSDQAIDDEDFYEILTVSTHFTQIYSSHIAQFAKNNNVGNGQRHCWSKLGFCIWMASSLLNVFVLCLLLIGCWIFVLVWFIAYFSIDGDAIPSISYTITTIYGSLFVSVSFVFQLILLMIQCTFLFPNSNKHIQTSAAVPRIIFNLFFVFYLCGFTFLLFDFVQLSHIHIAIKYALSAFCAHLFIIPFLSIWQIVKSNMYLWR